MNTARLTSRTGVGIAMVWFCIGTTTTLLGAWARGFSLAPALILGLVLATVAGVALTNCLPDDGDEGTGERESGSAPAEDNDGKQAKAA